MAVVSIIIPVYNVAPYVAECLESVMAQTYAGEMECLVVDDGGTDDSMAIVSRLVDAYVGPIRFIILRHTHNRGLSAARNTGILAANGDYLFFLDSDDAISPDCIEKMMAVASTDSAVEIVQGRFDKNRDSLARPLCRESYQSHIVGNKAVRMSLFRYRQMGDTGWNKLIKRDFVLGHSLFFKEGLLHEDALWKHYALKHFNNVWFLPDITYHYRIRAGSIMTGTSKSVSAQHYCRIFQEIAGSLTPGDAEEVRYYGVCMAKLCFVYASYSKDIKGVMKMYREEARKQKLYPICWAMTGGYILGLFRYGWVLVPFLNRLKSPCIFLGDFRRLVQGFKRKRAVYGGEC